MRLDLYQETLVMIRNPVLLFELKMLQALYRAAWQKASCSPKTPPALVQWKNTANKVLHAFLAVAL